MTVVKLIALYDKPDDPDAFWDHYLNVHAPLTKTLPGLQAVTLNRVTADAFGGEPRYVLIAEMVFPDRATFEEAMRSGENRALGKDLMSFARGRVSVLVTEEF